MIEPAPLTRLFLFSVFTGFYVLRSVYIFVDVTPETSINIRPNTVYCEGKWWKECMK